MATFAKTEIEDGGIEMATDDGMIQDEGDILDYDKRPKSFGRKRIKKHELPALGKRIRVEYKRTIQTRPYESASVSFSIESDVSPNETTKQHFDSTYEFIKEEVEFRCNEILDEEGK